MKLKWWWEVYCSAQVANTVKKKLPYEAGNTVRALCGRIEDSGTRCSLHTQVRLRSLRAVWEAVARNRHPRLEPARNSQNIHPQILNFDLSPNQKVPKCPRKRVDPYSSTTWP